MICIIALVVFGILGIFSATHRKVAFEAFNCVFRKATLRKCNSDLDKRLKSQIIAKIMNKSPKTANLVYKNFEIISWIFTIVMIVSLIYTILGGYNFYMYGNCNGPNQEGFCIFDPTGSNTGYTSAQDLSCSTQDNNEKSLSMQGVNISIFPQTNPGSENEVLFIGCYACEYTRKSYPEIRKLALREDTNFIFAHLPVKDQTYFISDIINCVNKENPNKIIELNDLIFSMNITQLSEKEAVLNAINKIGLNSKAIEECALNNETQELSKIQVSQIKETGVYGTPTVFVNNVPIVGPKPYRVYKRELK